MVRGVTVTAKTVSLFVCILCCSVSTVSAASFRTRNFLVTAPSRDIAQRIGERAEDCRRELAISWLGIELSPWKEPCAVRVYVRTGKGATGETSFEFENRRPARLRMTVLGPLEELTESILPHEVSHLVLATHFGRRLPPWIDEGASTLVESASEREKLRKAVRKILSGQRQLSITQLIALSEYPRDIVPLYTQGHALSSFLIKRGGKKRFIQFVQDGLARSDRMKSAQRSPSSLAECWAQAIAAHYGFASLENLEARWLTWISDASFLAEDGGGILLVRTTNGEISPVGMMAELHDRMTGRI